MYRNNPNDYGGVQTNKLISAATTNATLVKNNEGYVYGWYMTNSNAAARYVKLYNKASAPTVGTDAPKMTVMIPANGGCTVEFANGIPFPIGIGVATTTGAADSDTAAVAASEVIVNLLYN